MNISFSAEAHRTMQKISSANRVSVLDRLNVIQSSRFPKVERTLRGDKALDNGFFLMRINKAIKLTYTFMEIEGKETFLVASIIIRR